MFLSWLDGRPSPLGIATGMVVGLAAVTPASGFVTPLAAMVIGAVAAPLSYCAMHFRDRRRLDESLDVWACHGIASTWGMIATGLFATVAVNADGANKLIFIYPVEEVIRIRTRERSQEAMTYPGDIDEKRAGARVKNGR